MSSSDPSPNPKRLLGVSAHVWLRLWVALGATPWVVILIRLLGDALSR